MPSPDGLPWWHEDYLAAAFRRVRRNGGGPGGDGVSVEDFSHSLAARLRRLSLSLVGCNHQPRPHRVHFMRKMDGRWRMIAVPCVIDRVWQTALAAALSARFEPLMSPASFAFRPGLSVEHALARVSLFRLRGFEWLIETDVADFFPSLPHDVVKAVIARDFACPVAEAMLTRWLARLPRGVARKGRGLPQGSPLSPVLANHALTGFDHALDRGAARLVRYADDMIILTRRREDAISALARAETELTRLCLTLNPTKTALRHVNEGVDFLGCHLRGGWLGRR